MLSMFLNISAHLGWHMKTLRTSQIILSPPSMQERNAPFYHHLVCKKEMHPPVLVAQFFERHELTTSLPYNANFHRKK